MTVGCVAHDFYPNSLSFRWSDASGAVLTSVQYPPAERNHKYTGVSLVQISKSDWDSGKSLKCSVSHAGTPTVLSVHGEAFIGLRDVLLSPVQQHSFVFTLTLVLCAASVPAQATLVLQPTEDARALVCMMEDAHSGALDSFKWRKNDAELSEYMESPLQKVGESHSAVSILKITDSDWDSEAVYTCEVVYEGNTYIKKASKGEGSSLLLI